MKSTMDQLGEKEKGIHWSREEGTCFWEEEREVPATSDRVGKAFSIGVRGS